MIAAVSSLLTATTETTFDVPANIVFAGLAIVMIFAAIRVVTTKNVFHAALWLVMVLAGVGLNFLLLQAEFVAVSQFLVYLGAIVVLIIFGVMLTRAELGVADDLDNKSNRLAGIAIGLLLFAVMAYALIGQWGSDKLGFEAYERLPEANTNGRTQAVADAIFGQYLIPFEMISVLLLASLIGAIVLARKD